MSKEKNYRILVFVHEDGVWTGKAKQLEAIVRGAYKTHVDPSLKIQMVWLQMPDGQAYLAGHPSTASMLTTPVPDGTAQEVRERFMLEICHKWMAATGCDVNEIICNAINKSLSDEFIATNLSRFHPDKRKKLLGRLAIKALWHRFTKGFLSISTNMPR